MNNSEYNKLHDHIESGDLDGVAKTLESNPDLMRHETPFGTWLHIAANNGELEIVKWLIEAGIEVNALGGIAGGNALTEAAEGGHVEVVKCLLRHGAEMNLTKSEWNPLFAAIVSGHMEVVKVLLKAGIDFRKAYTGTGTKNLDAHFLAVEQGQVEIAKVIEEWAKGHK